MTWIDAVDDIAVVFCTVPNIEVAERIAHAVVEARLAACTNIVPGLRSIYRWEGKICDETEVLLVIKTPKNRARDLAERIRTLHPYTTPEVIAIPVTSGLAPYLDWVRAETEPD